MPLEQALQALRSDPELRRSPDGRSGFVEWRELPAQDARYGDVARRDEPAHSSTRSRRRGIDRLYTHQAAAFDAVAAAREHRRRHADRLRQDALLQPARPPDDPRRPEARALYLFPTKALAQDQMQELHALVSDLGARHRHVHLRRRYAWRRSPQGARGGARRRHEPGHAPHRHPAPPHQVGEALREPALRRHRRAAPVSRRLRQPRRERHPAPAPRLPLLRLRPASSSAARPPSPTRPSWRRTSSASPSTLIDDNGAPRGRKVVAIYNPPVVNRELGIRESSVDAARTIALAAAPVRRPDHRLRAVPRARRAAAALPARGAEAATGPRHRPRHRRADDRGLPRRLSAERAPRRRAGPARRVASAASSRPTRSSWASISAASMPRCSPAIRARSRAPGSRWAAPDAATAWRSPCIVASSSPLNQYVASNPDYLFDTSPEAGLVDPDNLLVRISHMKCAAFELPFEEGDITTSQRGVAGDFGPSTPELLDLLADEGVLVKAGGRYHWMAEVFPAEGVSLRSGRHRQLRDHRAGAEAARHRRDRPPGRAAADPRRGDLHARRPAVPRRPPRLGREEGVRPQGRRRLLHRREPRRRSRGAGVVRARARPRLRGRPRRGGRPRRRDDLQEDQARYERERRLGQDRIPEQSRHTTGYWFALRRGRGRRAWRAHELQDGLWGMAHLLRHLAPIFLMCDPRDLQAVAQMRSPFTELPDALPLREPAGRRRHGAPPLRDPHATSCTPRSKSCGAATAARVPRLRWPVDRRTRHEQTRRHSPLAPSLRIRLPFAAERREAAPDGVGADQCVRPCAAWSEGHAGGENAW